jgi:16S rRNA (cytidine1402-2'-O)-methyltransferase
MSAGVLYVVATPIGNLEDMTYRAVRVLGSVDVIAAEDTRAAARLLTHFGVGRARVISLFEGNEAARTGELMNELEAGRHVALISEAGTPGVSDPGERLVRAAADAGVRVEVIPGPSAVIAALVGSGLSTRPFAFHGFPPREAGARRVYFGALRGEAATLIFYESPERVAATLADLCEAFGAERRAVLARELTKVHEEYVRGTLGELCARYAGNAPRGECTLVVEGTDRPAGAGLDQDELEARVRALLDSGLGPRDAAARLVAITGKPRRQLYQLALSLCRERASSGEPGSSGEPQANQSSTIDTSAPAQANQSSTIDTSAPADVNQSSTIK